MTEQRLLDILRKEAQATSGVKTAKKYRISQSFLARVLAGEQPVGAKLAGAMGYERVVSYRPVRAA